MGIKINFEESLNNYIIETKVNGLNGNNSYYILIDIGKAIRSKGETVLKVVFDTAGKIWTVFPVK